MSRRILPTAWRLLNAERLEAIPAALARARANADARALARADWLIRRKGVGRFLAVRRDNRLIPLFRNSIPTVLEVDLTELAASAANRPTPVTAVTPAQMMGLTGSKRTEAVNSVASSRLLRLKANTQPERPHSKRTLPALIPPGSQFSISSGAGDHQCSERVSPQTTRAAPTDTNQHTPVFTPLKRSVSTTPAARSSRKTGNRLSIEA